MASKKKPKKIDRSTDAYISTTYFGKGTKNILQPKIEKIKRNEGGLKPWLLQCINEYDRTH